MKSVFDKNNKWKRKTQTKKCRNKYINILEPHYAIQS